MSPLTIAVILQFAAVAVIVAEVIIPSGGLLGLLSACLVGYSLYTVFCDVSVNAGYLLLGIDVAALPLVVLACLKLLAKSPATLRTELSSSAGVTSQSPGLETLVGRKGVALTNLRPSGIAVIDGRRVDVVSRGEYIDKDSDVAVIAVEGNQVIVAMEE